MARRGPWSLRGPLLAAAVLALLVLVILTRSGRERASHPPPSSPEATLPGSGAPSPETSRPAAPPREGPLRLHSGETGEISAADLGEGAPVVLELVLPPGVAARSGRLVTPGRESVVLDAEVEGRSGTVTVGLPAERLRTPGRYLVELRTDERSALPLRRFVVEVR